MTGTLRPRRMLRPLLLYYLYSLLFLLGACSSPATVRPSHIDIIRPLGTMLYTYHGHLNAISDLAWSPDGTRIASASYDKKRYKSGMPPRASAYLPTMDTRTP